MSLKITEIFYSIQGESRTVGRPTVFVRLTGCPMRCTYCDTAYAFQGGERKHIDEILVEVSSYSSSHVCVTGGEPLAQPDCHELLTSLCNAGYSVSLETGNAIDIAKVDPRVYVVLDIKTPASSEEPNNKYSNLDHIKPNDALKFVICNRTDYEWARELLNAQTLSSKCEVFFSPSADQQDAAELADWILQDQLPVSLQLQLHKVLWQNAQGR